MSKSAPFGTDDQPKFETHILGGRPVLRPIGVNGDGVKKQALGTPERLKRSRDVKKLITDINPPQETPTHFLPGVLPPISPGRGIEAPSANNFDFTTTDSQGDLHDQCREALLHVGCGKGELQDLQQAFEQDDVTGSKFLLRQTIREVMARANMNLPANVIDRLLDRFGGVAGTGDRVDYGKFVQFLHECIAQRESARSKRSSLPRAHQTDPLLSNNSLVVGGNASTSSRAQVDVERFARSTLLGTKEASELPALQLPSESRVVLPGRHDAKLVASLVRDWTANHKRSDQSVQAEQFNLEKFQLSLAEIDTNRTGRIPAMQV